MKDQILALLGTKGYFPADAAELLKQLQLPAEQHPEFRRALRELEQAGRVARIKEHRYILPSEADLIPGRIRMNRQGKGFLDPDDPELKEIEIPASATSTALNGDRVLVRKEVAPRGLRPGAQAASTGSVVRVLERRRTQIVGTLQESRNFLFVIPDDPRIPHDIYVPVPRDVGRPAQAGDKVVVELREWLSPHTNPEGEVIEVLGPPDEEGVDMLSVLRQYDLPLRFPKQVLHEARAIGTTVTEGDLAGRVDCRNHRVITIDPDDAKDFDDAICLERADSETWRLWVHIADVSHYVKPGTALDEEARKRGNSTYLVDRVIPMLPEALSNELCSLKPDVDRLTKCVEFLLSDSGRVLSTRFYPAVIHSQRRFSYQEAFAVLQRKPEGAIEEMLHETHRLAQCIRRERFKAGSLELDFPEMKIRLDERGRVLRIDRVENDVSHQLIEECMLLANEAVAARLMSLRRPAVYRVHESPDERRLQEYREDVLSHNVPCGNLSQRVEVQRLLHRLGGLPIGPALKIGFLKSLMRACYSVEPLGHYGLAKTKYTHFTSPIRRYADLVVHRSLFDQVAGSPSALKEIGDHLSETERNSADAERDSKDVKLHAFLRAQIESGQPITYSGLVTDVRNFGFFVDVPGLAMSGLVPLSMLEDDFYVFDSERSQLVGRRTRRVIRLGDRPDVQIAKVDSFKKQVDFRLAVTGGGASARSTGSRGTGAGRKTERPPQRASERLSQRPPSRSGQRPAKESLHGQRPPVRPVGRPSPVPLERTFQRPPRRTPERQPERPASRRPQAGSGRFTDRRPPERGQRRPSDAVRGSQERRPGAGAVAPARPAGTSRPPFVRSGSAQPTRAPQRPLLRTSQGVTQRPAPAASRGSPRPRPADTERRAPASRPNLPTMQSFRPTFSRRPPPRGRGDR